MAKKMTEWPSKRGPITRIMPSDGCKGDTIPLAVGKWYVFHEYGCHLGNVGLNGRHNGHNSKIMLKLRHKEPLFIGGNRFCYVYPGDPDKCIKVLQPDRTGAARKQLEHSLKKHRSKTAFDDQIKEIKAYRTLIRQQNPRIWDHIQEYFGTEQTDMGLGIITRLYRNHVGGYSSNLQDLVRTGITPELAAGIEEFKVWLREEMVITRDLLPHNIIVVSHEDGRQQVIIVDGLGNSEFIPISTWFKLFARRKIQRKLVRFQHRIDILLPN